MLKPFNLHSAQPLAQKFSDNGLIVEAIQGTVLAEVVNASYHPSLERDDDPTISVQDVLLTTDGKGSDSGISHSETMDHFVKLAAKTVSDNIKLARTVVNPLVQSVAERAQGFINEAEIKAINYLSVIPRFVPKAWSNPVLEGLVEKYNQTPAEDVTFRNLYPREVPEKIIEMLKTGTSRIDSDLDEMVKNLGDERLVELYDMLFAQPEIGARTESLEMRLSDFARVGRTDHATLVFIFLIARRLYAEVPEGVAVPLADHREYITTLMSQAGRAIVRAMENHERNLKQKNLNISWPGDFSDDPSYSVIAVNGDVYNEWLKAGGSPEILFGSNLTDKETDFDRLLERKAYYEKVWERQVNIRSREVAAKTMSVTISALRRAVALTINDMAEEDLPTPDRGLLHGRLEEALSGLNERQVKDFYPLVRRVTCYTLFAGNPDALTILESIDEIGRQNPKMDVREVALLATIDLVADWVACQMKVAPAGFR